MKSYRKELWFNTPARQAYLNITGQFDVCLEDWFHTPQSPSIDNITAKIMPMFV